MKGNRAPRGANDTKKKMIIKPFKSTPKVPANFEAEAWAKLQSAVHAVHNNALVNISKEELYRVGSYDHNLFYIRCFAFIFVVCCNNYFVVLHSLHRLWKICAFTNLVHPYTTSFTQNVKFISIARLTPCLNRCESKCAWLSFLKIFLISSFVLNLTGHRRRRKCFHFLNSWTSSGLTIVNICLWFEIFFFISTRAMC